MKRERRKPRLYIMNMLNVCERLDGYLRNRTEAEFLEDLMLQDAVLRNIEVFGEAAKQLLDNLPDAPTRFPAVPFQDMYRTRNRLLHGYTDLRIDTVWETAVGDVIPLRSVFLDILDNWPADLQ